MNGRTNAIIERLGLHPNDRAVVMHGDDFALCQSTVQAYVHTHEEGILSSASAMVLSGWFPAFAKVCRGPKHDIGVHLTLNSEWENYRLSPLSGGASSLVDDAGYLHALAAETHQHADVGQVTAELHAQIHRALKLGVDVTHVDSHMLALVDHRLLGTYLGISREFSIPNGLVRFRVKEMADWCRIPMSSAELVCDEMFMVKNESLIVFDQWVSVPLDSHTNRLAVGQRMLDSLPTGLSMFVCHPAVDTPELRAIAHDWQARVADFELFTNSAWRKSIEASGIRVFNMRDIRHAMFNKN